MMKQALAALALLAAAATTRVSAHGFLSSPKPRQYRSETNSWQTYNVHNGGGLLSYGNTSPPNNDVANLNGLIGGAPSNGETTGFNEGDSGLCGDRGDRKWFMAPNQFGPTEPRATWMAGGTARVEVAITAYHGGHFEFRLAVPEDGGADTAAPITQTMLNRHILEIAPSTPFYSDVTNYQGMQGYGGYSGHGGEFKCRTTGGHLDATATSPQAVAARLVLQRRRRLLRARAEHGPVRGRVRGQRRRPPGQPERVPDHVRHRPQDPGRHQVRTVRAPVDLPDGEFCRRLARNVPELRRHCRPIRWRGHRCPARCCGADSGAGAGLCLVLRGIANTGYADPGASNCHRHCRLHHHGQAVRRQDHHCV